MEQKTPPPPPPRRDRTARSISDPRFLKAKSPSDLQARQAARNRNDTQNSSENSSMMTMQVLESPSEMEVCMKSAISLQHVEEGGLRGEHENEHEIRRRTVKSIDLHESIPPKFLDE